MKRKMLLLGIWLLSVTCRPSKIKLSAQEGGLVEISCPYGSGYETYPKYFSVGSYGERKTLFRTTDNNFKKSRQTGKYEIHDDTKQRLLHVTIHNLNLKDAGTYWCEIDAYTFDPKTEIELKVYKALTPPRVTSNPPILTSGVQARTQQSTDRISRATTWSSSPDGLHTESPPLPPLAGLGLFLASGACVLLSLLAIVCIGLLKHKQATVRGVGYQTSTHSTVRSQGHPREPDPPVNISSSDIVYATVTKSRDPCSHTPICHSDTQRPDPALGSSITSCLQDDDAERVFSQRKVNTCSSEDVQLLYSTVTIRPSASPSVVYATIKRPTT